MFVTIVILFSITHLLYQASAEIKMKLVSCSMDFAKKQLTKHGWKHGKNVKKSNCVSFR